MREILPLCWVRFINLCVRNGRGEPIISALAHWDDDIRAISVFLVISEM